MPATGEPGLCAVVPDGILIEPVPWTLKTLLAGFTINSFSKLRSNIYNLGLSSANISKIMLARKIKKIFPKLKIKIVKNKKDPDKRDYFVSNRKIEKKGFKAKISLEDGIQELLQYFGHNKNKIINNY